MDADTTLSWRSSRRWPSLAAWCSLAISVLWLATLIVPSDEAVLVRNALILRLGTADDFAWTPDNVPAGYRLEPGAPPAEFVRIAHDILGAGGLNPVHGLDAGRRIAERLMGAPKFVGDPIQADNLTTYREITGAGRGYCADFTQIFNAIALAGGLPVREWSLSFSRFGAGHAFNEVYDRDLGQWVMLDSFHSLYFVDPTDRRPLSVLEVHDRLLSIGGQQPVEIVRIRPERFPFRSDAIALDYYRRGMSELAMVWGVNPFEYEASAPVRWATQLSRSLGQVTAIALGVYPMAQIYPRGVNDRELRELDRTRLHFLLALLSCALACVLVCWPMLIRDRLAAGDALDRSRC